MAEMRSIGKKKDLWHLIRQGMLVQLHFDFETTSLVRNFAQVTAYGDAVGDIAGNFIGSDEISIRLQERYLPSPKSLLVTQTRYRELIDPSRVNHAEAMGRIANRFEHAVEMLENMGLPEREIKFSKVRRSGKDIFSKEVKEKVLEYPLEDDNGNIVHHVRYHPESRRIAYRFDEDHESRYYENFENNYYVDEDGSKWRFTEPRLLVSGYRIKWADINWLRVNMVRAGVHPSNTFFAYSKSALSDKEKPKNFACDASTVAINTHLFGPIGEESLKMGERIDPQFGGGVVSAKLESIMQANTRYENRPRGIRGGILMPDDGTVYDKNRGHHSPAYDAKASFALYNYCRAIAPDIVRQMEEQADEQELKRILPGMDMTDQRPPLYAMPRNNYPHGPVADPVLHIAQDNRDGNYRREVLMRMDVNLRAYARVRDGKKLSQLSASDFYAMMKDRGNGDSILRLESLRRWPGVIPLRDSLETSAGRNWDMNKLRDTAEDNFNYINENPEIIMRIRAAVTRLNREVYLRTERENAMMEEQFPNSGFGDLDYLRHEVRQETQARMKEKSMPARGQMPGFFEMLYNKAQEEYRFYNMVEEGLHRLALHPLRIDVSDDDAALENFYELCKRVKAKFEKKGVPYGNLFKPLLDKEKSVNGRKVLSQFSAAEARKFRWNLRKRFLKDDELAMDDKSSAYSRGLFDYAEMRKGRILFPNIDRNCDYRVLDGDGRVLPLDYLQRQYLKNPKFVRDKLEKREWRMQFYRMSSNPSVNVTLNLFDIAGRMDELPTSWRRKYDMLTRFSLNGPPNEDASNARWYNFDKTERELNHLALNASVREESGGAARSHADYADGEAESYVKTDLGQRIIGEYIEDLAALKKKYGATEKFNYAARFDPKSGLPYDYIEHEVPAESSVIIDLPDAHIRRPLEDSRFAPFSFVSNAISDAARKKMEAGASVILRGQQTGRMYYAGPVSVRNAPPEAPAFRDFYERARHAYVQEAGEKFPAQNKRSVLITQQPLPLAHTRRNIDPSLQTVKVPSLYFDALVSPRMGFFRSEEPLTGLLLPVDYCPQELKVGAKIRFREMDAPMTARLKGIEGHETGHVYESRLKKFRVLKVGALIDEIKTGRISDATARRFGYAGAVDMWEKVNDTFVSQESPDPMNQKIYLLEFSPVDKRSWAYWNPMYAPDAAMTWKGQPTPPSAYRWFNEKAGNDNNRVAARSLDAKPKDAPKRTVDEDVRTKSRKAGGRGSPAP